MLYQTYLFADQIFDLPGTSSSAFSSSDVPMSVPAELQLIGDSIHGKADENEGSNTVTTTEPLSCGIVREGSPLEHSQVKVGKFLSSPRTPRFKKDVARRMNLLQKGNMSRQKCLTPTAKRFYKVAKGMLKTARELNEENASNRRRLVEVQHLIESGNLFSGKVNKSTERFINSQVKMQAKDSRGRRFSLDDKIFGLSLLKQSPKCYRLLRKIFALPSRKTLMSLLNKIPFTCGTNQNILNCLKESVHKMDKLDRYCCVLFDEMYLDASLHYHKKNDDLVGFEDIDSEKRKKIADHVLVFIARGIRKKWKQPISFYFSDGGLKAADLAVILKQTISSLQEIGLTVITMVCDQLSINGKVINSLKEATNREALLEGRENHCVGFSIGGVDIIPFYDPPHLLKGIRNNLLEHDVKFKWQKDEQVASWSDVMVMYEADVGDHDTRMLNRLTDAHIYKNKIKKMKVKNAAQVFSQRMSSTMRALVRLGCASLPVSAADTADFLLFVDKLFDSVNGAALYPDHGKPLRCVVTESSAHLEFWNEAIKVLQTVKFLKGRQEFVPPSIKNWIVTIKGFIALWNNLKSEGFKFLGPRNLNQDPLENFFGCIRSHGVRNINPTCSAFIASFKSLMVNNFVATHSPGANCEMDESEGALNTLRQFIQTEESEDMEGITTLSRYEEELMDTDFKFSNPSAIIITTHSYIAGYLAKSVLRTVKNCKQCYNILICPFNMPVHSYIEERAYRPDALLRPNTTFITIFSNCNDVCHHYLPKLCTNTHISKKLVDLALNHIVYNFECTEHNLLHIFVLRFVNFYINTWTRNVNAILKGTESRSKFINDSIKKIVYLKHIMHKKKKEKMRLLKQLNT